MTLPEKFQMNLEALRTMVVVITNDRAFTVKRDDRLPTSICDLENKVVTLTIKNVPDGLPTWKRERLLDGECAHEAGHVVITMPYIKIYETWAKLQKFPFLAKYVYNVYEDLRVNFYVANRYRFDFGGRMEELHRINARSMVHYAENLDLTTKRLEKACVALALLTLTSEDMTKHLDSEAAEAVKRAADILKANKFKRVTKDMVDAVNRAYHEIEKLVKRPHKSKKPKSEEKGESEAGEGEQEGEAGGEEQEGEGEDEGEEGEREEQEEEGEGEGGEEQIPGEGEPEEDWDGGENENYDRDIEPDWIPSPLGGNMPLDATKEDIEKAEQEMKQLQEAAQKALEQAMQQQQQQGIATGLTTGVEEPHPEPNPAQYRWLVQKNTQYISALLNRLKSLQVKRITTERFVRRGRYMIELHSIWKALSQGKGKPYEKRFEGTTIDYDTVKAKMALLVDMSGSMDEDEAKDALTIIAETAGRWVPSEDFAIATFGTNHQIVKAFIEPYLQARTRIGGVRGMGSTNMARPLSVLIKMLSSYRRSDYQLVLIVVSDFSPTDIAEDSVKAIEEAERLGIKVIGCGLCQSDLAQVRQFTTRATYIQYVHQLPLLFFQLYRASVSGKLR